MALRDWITANEMTVGEFARLIGVSEVSVHRYCSGDRVPTRVIMPVIRRVTRGEVTADDFYPDAPQDAA